MEEGFLDGWKVTDAVESEGSVDWLMKRLDEYLKDKNHRYAIAMEGDWGSGKTRFLEQRVRPHIKTAMEMDLIRVSMFGVSNADQLYERIAMSLIDKEEEQIDEGSSSWRDDKRKAKRIAKRIAKIMTSALSSSILGKIGVSLNVAASMQTIVDLLLGDKHFLILDDVERRATDSDDKALFGAVNALVEGRGIKVCLVSNQFDGEAKSGGRGFDQDIREKLVWKVYRFKQTPSELVDDIFNDLPDDIAGVNPLDAVHTAANLAQCTNARVMIRADEFVRRLCAMSAIADAGIPEQNRRKALVDTVHFALLTCMGREPVQPTEPESNSLMDLMEFDDQQRLFARYSDFPEIGRALGVSGFVSPDELNEGFLRYIGTYYPDNATTITINRIASRIRGLLELEDRDVTALIPEYCQAVVRADFSPSTLRDVIMVYSVFERLGFDCSLSREDVITACEKVIGRDPEEALHNLQPTDFLFGTEPDTGRQIADVLVGHAEVIRSKRVVISLEQNGDDPITADRLVDAMSAAKRYGPASLTQIDPALIADVFASSDAFGQEAIRRVFVSSEYWLMPSDVTDVNDLLHWVSSVERAVESTTVSSRTGRMRKGWFIENLNERSEELQQAAGTTGTVV